MKQETLDPPESFTDGRVTITGSVSGNPDRSGHSENGIEAVMMKGRQIVKGRLENSGGFTLVEAIAVLVIIAIISGVAVSRSMSTQNDLIQQASIVKTHLRFAQLKALNDDVNTWRITFNSSSYALSCIGSNCPASTPDLPSEGSNSHAFPSGVTASSATVTFDRWGSPGGNAVGINLTQAGQIITITIAANTGYITP